MELKFVDNFLYFIMNIFELTVSEFRNFSFLCCLVCDLQNICNFTAYTSFMSDNFWLEMHMSLMNRVNIEGIRCKNEWIININVK